MKKAIFTVMAVLAVFAIVGCSNGSTDPGKGPEVPVTPTSYTVTFDKNNTDSGSTAPSPATKTVTPPQTTTTAPVTEPTRSGYIFQNYNSEPDGSGTRFSNTTAITGNITFYAQWLRGSRVNFDKNSSDATDPVPLYVDVIEPDTTVSAAGGLPTPPEREGFEFRGWNYLQSFDNGEDPDDSAFDENALVTQGVTVYAVWEFVGGTPVLGQGEGNRTTIVHNMPLFTADNGAELNADGTYKLITDGTLDYLFPTDVGAAPGSYSYSDFDYFIVSTQVISSEEGNVTLAQVRRYGGNSTYTGGGTAKDPWLIRENERNIVCDVLGAGTSAGVRIRGGSTTNIAKLKIISVTFYKAPRYTVTFDINDQVSGTSAGTPLYKQDGSTQHPGTVYDIWGKDSNHNGTGIGEENWPLDPFREEQLPPFWFLGWYDGTNLVTETSPITKDMTLVAKWSDQLPVGWIELIDTGGTLAPLYGFEFPADKTLGDYYKLTAKIKATADFPISNWRFRAWGTFPLDLYVETDFPLRNKDGVGAAAKSIRNAAAELLLTNNAGSGAAAAGFSQNADDGWKEYTLDLKATKDAAYNTTNPSTGAWDDDFTDGITLLGIAPIGGAGNNDPRSYYIKDIFLTNDDGTDRIPALDPRDPKLWSGKGASAIVVNGSIGGTRKVLAYEDG
jgi:hypothetical protein